jgi:uracil-DNA glycosylase
LSKIIGKNKNVIFLILGKKAEETCEGLNIKNKIITSHPSPLGYTKGFKNSKIFSRVNEILKNEDEQLIE